MSYKKCLSMVICFLLIITSLAGCKSKTVSNDANGDDNSAASDNKVVTMGRYVEAELPLPDGVTSDNMVSVIKGQNDKLEIYTIEGENSTYYCYSQKDDGSFERTEQPWLNDNNNNDIVSIIYGEDENLYAYYTVYGDSSSRSEMIKASPDRQSSEKLELPILKQKANETEDYTLYTGIDKAGVLKNGTIIISDIFTNVIHILDAATGEEMDKLQVYQGDSSNQYVPSFAVIENSIVTMNATGDRVMVYNTETKESEQEIKLDEYRADSLYSVAADKTIHMCNKDGISKVAPDGSLWENVVDGALCSLNMPSIYVNNFIQCGTENEKPLYYCFVSDTGEGVGKILQFTYDSTIPSVPSKELTVYSLKENKTIRQAISEYQRKNTDVIISYNIAMSEDGSATKEDYVKALNTELLAGKGADVLILDGLPKDSYVEKGVLEDISKLVTDKTDSGELSKEMLENYSQDGKFYSIPTRFSVPFVYGLEDAVSAGNSLKTLSEYTNKQGTDKVMTALTEDALTKMFLYYYYPEIITKDKDESGLEELLDEVKMVMDQASDEEKSIVEGARLEDINSISGNMSINSAYYLSAQKIKLGFGSLDDVSDMMIPFQVVNDNQCSYNIINQSYIPAGVVGINSASEKKELAKDFINCLLSKEVQSVKLYDGFPINQNALEEAFKEIDDIALSTNVGNREDLVVSAEWPKEEYREGVNQLLKQLKNPIEADEVLIDKITKEAGKYYSGEASKDETIHAIQSSVSTYLAE